MRIHAALRISRLFSFEESKKRGRPSVRHRGLRIRIQRYSLLLGVAFLVPQLLQPRWKNVSVSRLQLRVCVR